MLVLNGVCSWQELNSFWSFEDIRKCAAMLEYKGLTDKKVEKLIRDKQGRN